MRIGCSASLMAWLLGATMLMASCSSQAESELDARARIGDVSIPIGNIAMRADEFADFNRQSPTEQRRLLDAILTLHPDAVGARFLRLQAEDDLADFSAMISDSELLLGDPSFDRRLRPTVLDWRAEALIQARRFAEAISATTEALSINDADAAALFARGWARFLDDDKQAQSALADLDRALQLKADAGIGYSRRAIILRKEGKPDLAATDFEQAVKFAPNDGPSHLEYGELLLESHHLEGALAQFDLAARAMPSDAQVWVRREETDFALKHFDDVVTDAARAIELGAMDGHLANAHSYLATALWKKSDFAGAAREFQKTLALFDDPRVANSLALMQWYSGQFPEAVEMLRKRATSSDSASNAPLWLFVVRVHAAPADEVMASAELEMLAPPHQPHAWTDTLVSLMLGRSTLDAALAEADASPTNQLRAGRRCEADYYAAERLLMHGEDISAKPLLEEAYWVCPSTYVEADAVVAERRLIEARSESR